MHTSSTAWMSVTIINFVPNFVNKLAPAQQYSNKITHCLFGENNQCKMIDF